MRVSSHFAFLSFFVLPGMSFGAEPEIYRCAQEDGTVAFQETPCPEPVEDRNLDSQSEGRNDSDESTSEDDFFEFANPFDEPEERPTRPEPVPLTPASPERTECEKTTRAAIDAIDLEMRKGYTREEGQQYLAELLELTKQLRACKQL